MKQPQSPDSTFNGQAPWNSPGWIARSRLVLDSYRYWLGEDLLLQSGNDLENARMLFELPRVVVAHGMETDPILCFCNRTALDLWEMELEEFLMTPSRLTAEPVHRTERDRLLQRTASQGYVKDYRGVRISRTGRRFWIEQATVWNLRTEQDEVVGQAATFAEWRMLEPDQCRADFCH